MRNFFLSLMVSQVKPNQQHNEKYLLDVAFKFINALNVAFSNTYFPFLNFLTSSLKALNSKTLSLMLSCIEGGVKFIKIFLFICR